MPEKTIDFDIDDSNLAIEIRYPGGDYSLMGLNGDEFRCLRPKTPMSSPSTSYARVNSW